MYPLYSLTDQVRLEHFWSISNIRVHPTKATLVEHHVGSSGLKIIKKEGVELIIPKPLLIKKLLF